MRSHPKNNSGETLSPPWSIMVGAPKAPNLTASSVLSFNACFTSGLVLACRRLYEIVSDWDQYHLAIICTTAITHANAVSTNLWIASPESMPAATQACNKLSAWVMSSSCIRGSDGRVKIDSQ